MDQTNCNSIKDSLIGFFGREMRISESQDGCVLVLPGKTIDDRYTAIFVDRKTPDYFVVHDAGKTSSELYSQGIHMTEIREEAFAGMAERMGAIFADGAFQVGCKQGELESAILAVNQCANLGMWLLLGHKPDFSDEPLLSRIERGMTVWNAPYAHKVEARVPVKGKRGNHVFDFVSFPAVERQPIAVKVLRPSDDSLRKAREYGFLAYDIEHTNFDRWLRLAVLAKADRWTRNAKQIVAASSSTMIEVDVGDEESLESKVPAALELLVA
jgi:hypothetical protein